MAQKMKFKPVITRIKLNPEQAVLSCACFSGGYMSGGGARKPDTCFLSPTKSTSNSKSTSTAVSS
ncbi:MAG: hypothetical protein PHH68_08030 [Candidatus Omnitrophica bacterium]|nr:hypothetical protein [Candidatus Omnitrophota bacterium]MDD5080246.1 hypothetical protein [Candidatus Omnitrophota bacterium]